MRRFLLFVALCVVQFASAQIRIISQDVVRKATEIETVDSSLQFSPESVDFGTIDEMSGVWQGRAMLQNRGADTLIITQIKTTCGCLKADITKRVLLPNEAVAVVLKFTVAPPLTAPLTVRFLIFSARSGAWNTFASVLSINLTPSILPISPSKIAEGSAY